MFETVILTAGQGSANIVNTQTVLPLPLTFEVVRDAVADALRDTPYASSELAYAVDEACEPDESHGSTWLIFRDNEHGEQTFYIGVERV